MTMRICALVLLSLMLSACESSPTDTNSNTPAKATPVAAASPAATAVPSAEASPASKVELKTGDKVKFSVNGALADAIVVGLDDKSGKVTIRVSGETKDRTVAVADIVRQ